MSMLRRLFLLGTITGLLTAVGLGAFIFWPNTGPNQSRVDLDNSDQIARGQTVYTNNCASCHGAKLEGQPNWRQRRGDGRLPAPPHDESGHTWHHSDFVLFGLTKNGPQSLIGSDYQSDMPAFSDSLDDEEIWAVITFIKSTWSPRIHRIQAEAEKKRR